MRASGGMGAAQSLLGGLAAHRGPRGGWVIGWQTVIRWTLWGAFAIVSLLAFAAPVRWFGDGHEYHAMAQAVAGGRPPALTSDELAGYSAWANAQPAESRFRGPRLERSEFRSGGRQDFPHFWFYSLLAAPLVAGARLVGAHEQFGFVALNVLLLGLALWRVQKAFYPALALLMLASPIIWYVNKAHTEVFTFSLLCVTVAEARRGRFLWAALAAAAASTQNPPILTAVLGLWAAGALRRVAVTRAEQPGTWSRGALRLSVGQLVLIELAAFLAILHPAYYWLRLGVYTPQRLDGSFAPHVPSLGEYLAFLLDPDIGFLPWLPLLGTLALLGVVRVARSRGRSGVPGGFDLGLTALCALGSGAVFLFAFTQTTNVNHGASVHMSRYGTWLIPLMLPLLEPAAVWLARVAAPFLPAAGLGSFVAYAAYFHPAGMEQYLSPAPLSQLVQAWLPCAYRPLPEIFFERHIGRDGGSGPDPGSAANAECTLILLSSSSATTPCRLSQAEWQAADTLYGAGWRSVWIVRPSILEACGASVSGGAGPSATPSRADRRAPLVAAQIPYPQLVRRVRDVVARALPADATVVMVSNGDDELLKLDRRTAWHFPQAEDGGHAGGHPETSEAAIANLEVLRVNGGEFLVFPSTEFWWFDDAYYRDFARHIESHYARVWVDEYCVVYRLSGA